MSRRPANSIFFPMGHPLVRKGLGRVGYGCAAKVVIDRQVTSWLFTNVRTGNWHREQRYFKLGKDKHSTPGLLYTFKNPDHLLLFKLTWGGNV